MITMARREGGTETGKLRLTNAEDVPLFTHGELRIENVGTDKVYIAYNDQPLFSFGASDDVGLGRPRNSKLDIIAWADWQQAHGMNHLRNVMVQSFGFLDMWAQESGEQAVYHFMRTPDGRFDLDHFDQAFWNRVRDQVKALNDRGIIVQVSLFDGLALGASNVIDGHDIFWPTNYWKPENNVNDYTRSLDSCDKQDNVCPFVDEAVKLADQGDPRLLDSHKRWVRQVLNHTAIFGNSYIDIAHELGVRDIDKELDSQYVRRWVNEMINEVRAWETEHDMELILGIDATYLDREWIFEHPGFDILLWGWSHGQGQVLGWRYLYKLLWGGSHGQSRVLDWRYLYKLLWGGSKGHGQVLGWRDMYKKPYVPDESWPTTGKLRYRNVSHHPLMRKYAWKMMVNKVQLVNFYLRTESYEGLGTFEQYATILREFWNSIDDYPNMVSEHSKILSAPTVGKHMLESTREVVVYLESGDGVVGKNYEASVLTLGNLTMSEGTVEITIFHPRTGGSTTKIGTVSGGVVNIELPSFMDDIAVLIKPYSN